MSSLDPLGLGQRQAAARQRRAGQGPALDRQHVLGQPHAVGPQPRLDGVAVGGIDVGQDDVLARHQDRVAAELGDDVAQRAAQPGALVVDDAAAGIGTPR